MITRGDPYLPLFGYCPLTGTGPGCRCSDGGCLPLRRGGRESLSGVIRRGGALFFAPRSSWMRALYPTFSRSGHYLVLTTPVHRVLQPDDRIKHTIGVPPFERDASDGDAAQRSVRGVLI